MNLLIAKDKKLIPHIYRKDIQFLVFDNSTNPVFKGFLQSWTHITAIHLN